MASTAAHDVPAFSWSQRPQLVTFTFEGPLNTTDSSVAVLTRSTNGRLACSRSIPGTWFATDCTPDIQKLRTSQIEIAAFSNANSDDQATVSCLRASTTVNGLRIADRSNAPSGFKYSLIDSPTYVWPFVEDNAIRVPFVTSDAIAVLTALAKNYDGMRAPVVISLTSLIQSIGREATTAIVQKIMSLDEVVAVSADQLSSLAAAKSAAEAESIVNLCRPIDPTKPATPSPILTSAPAVRTATPVSPSPTKATTPAPQGNNGTAAPSPSAAPIRTDAPTIPTPSTSTSSTNVSAVPTRTAPLPSTMIPTSGSTPTPTATSTRTPSPTNSASSPSPSPTNSASSPTPTPINSAPSPSPTSTNSASTPSPTSTNSASTASPAPTNSSSSTPSPTGQTLKPITLRPSSAPNQTITTAPGPIWNIFPVDNGTTDSSNDSSSSSSSSKSTGYVPYVIGIGGGLCAMAVAIVYKVFKREDRFPPVITNGHVFESEDREIYDLEAYNSSVRVSPESHEGSSSYVHSDLESASGMS